jgi:type IV pilus assembly protein PilY1
VLFARDIEDGSYVNEWDTGVGFNQDPLKSATPSVTRPNGLASVAPIDVDSNFTADYAYAGDLFGNLWRFDLSGSSTTKIFSAVSADGKPQPITTRPTVIRHPLGDGYIVLFGTGKYLESTDNSQTGQVTQTFYGIWDKPSVNNWSVARDELLEQKILAEVIAAQSPSGYAYRVTTQNAISWKTSNRDGEHLGWFMDLVDPDDNANHGERQVSDPLARSGRVIFTTLIPTSDECAFGGTGWLMDIDALSGARLEYSPFDVNNDGVFSTNDYITTTLPDGGGTVTVPPSGRKSEVGIVPTPAILARPGGEKEYKYLSGSTGSMEMVVENTGGGLDVGRRGWFQYFRGE